ncbi:MAG TPA: class I SAM-dependent methyltransferase [Chitinophagaceae bacterium]|nr:class I SAM-dependent methyltransferase [Chitinophagaceae bacterium]
MLPTFENSPLLNRMRKNGKAIKPYLAQHSVTCYRIFDWDMPEYPLCIDFYEGFVQIAEYKTRHPLDEIAYRRWLDECIAVVKQYFYIGDEHISLKLRERQKGLQQYEKVDNKQHFFDVQEQGIQFRVNLHDYLDTGLFLDHRTTRQLVRESAKNKHVLNLFAYTGAFSVYAALGGAFSTTTVDLSNTYLNWAKENFKLNGLTLARHTFIKSDAKEWVKHIPKKKFDIIVLDPPTVSRSKMAKTKFDIQPDHPQLINDTLQHLAEDGVLYFSNNFREFEFQQELIEASSIVELTPKTIPPDFRNKRIHRCWAIKK